MEAGQRGYGSQYCVRLGPSASLANASEGFGVGAVGEKGAIWLLFIRFHPIEASERVRDRFQ